MPRPERVDDIEVEDILFATVTVNTIETNGTLLKAYAAFLEAAQKAGARVEPGYGGTRFYRPPTATEQITQLESRQILWDDHKKLYETLRDVGELEYNHQRNFAQQWAEAEGMPWPPESEPIKSFDAVIRDIDSVVTE